jgi:protein-disulfide isomerase
MICIIALVVFSIIGIFSAKYRIIAKEAFDCVFRRVTFRKCTTGLDKRLKAQITGNLMRQAPRVGRFTFKYFEWISWFFTILMIWSIVQSGISVYNYAAYGNCNGKGSDEFCIFDPLGTGARGHNETTGVCSVTGDIRDLPLIRPAIGASPTFGNTSSNLVIYEFGCYTCPYTRQAEPEMIKLRQDYSDKYLFVFKHYPILTHNYSYEAAIAAECARNQGKFWEYHESLFKSETFSNQTFLTIATSLNLDMQTFTKCYDDKETKSLVDADIEEGKKSGIYGTPTVFVNNDYLVGPKAYSGYKSLVKKND